MQTLITIYVVGAFAWPAACLAYEERQVSRYGCPRSDLSMLACMATVIWPLIAAVILACKVKDRKRGEE